VAVSFPNGMHQACFQYDLESWLTPMSIVLRFIFDSVGTKKFVPSLIHGLW